MNSPILRGLRLLPENEGRKSLRNGVDRSTSVYEQLLATKYCLHRPGGIRMTTSTICEGLLGVEIRENASRSSIFAPLQQH